MKSFFISVVISSFLFLSGCGNNVDSTSGTGVSFERGKPDRGDTGDDGSSPTKISARWNKDQSNILVSFTDNDGLSSVDGDKNTCRYEDNGDLGDAITDPNETKFVNKRILVRCEVISPIELTSHDCAVEEDKPCGRKGPGIKWTITYKEIGGKFDITP